MNGSLIKTLTLAWSLAWCVGAEPRLTHTDVFTSGKDGYHTYRIPAVETAPDGSLIAFAEARKYNGNDPGFGMQDIDLVFKRSTDNGATWSRMTVLEDPGELWSAANPATVVDRVNQRLWVFYIRSRPGRSSETSRPGTDDMQTQARWSDDSGQTWSEPLDLTAVGRDMDDKSWRASVPGPGGAIQTRKGRLVVPMWKMPFAVFAIFSDDHGRTWQRGELVPGIRGGNENQVVELADDRILIDIRQDAGEHRWLVESADGGNTWSEVRSGLPVTPVMCAIERLTLRAAGHDRNCLVWTGPKGPGRQRLVIRASYDEGKTFASERLISDAYAAYSDLTILKDATIGVLWERGVERGYQFITFTRLNREWLESDTKSVPLSGPAIPAADKPSEPGKSAQIAEDLALNFHLMHPGGGSLPGDPNAAFYLDGTYHLHYILAHPWKDGNSFSFCHVTSPDMLHWTWQPTKLQPSFTGHGMFSGTGFITKEGKPAAIYHGQGSGRNQIAIAKDPQLAVWEKPYPVDVRNADCTAANMNHWDPDCFLIGDTYYAISGGEQVPLLKSKDLKTWTYVGDFLRHDLPDVAFGEDISCPNFFPLGNKWMLLCISHSLGCRYYLGDWDAQGEQFVPQTHGRMNWRREAQSLFGTRQWRVDFFAPESVLTPDGRRVMWAWLATLGRSDGKMDSRTIQSLPRELSLPDDGILRIKPLRELETLRYDPVTLDDIAIGETTKDVFLTAAPAGKKIATLDGDAVELRITIPRDQAERKLFGFTLFSDGKGGGLPILFRPETGTLRIGTAEAPFSIADLPKSADLELRIFIDKYLVEVFANDRQAILAEHADYHGKPDLNAFSVGAATTLKKVEIWNLKPTNQGFREAQKNRHWEPETK